MPSVQAASEGAREYDANLLSSHMHGFAVLVASLDFEKLSPISRIKQQATIMAVPSFLLASSLKAKLRCTEICLDDGRLRA